MSDLESDTIDRTHAREARPFVLTEPQTEAGRLREAARPGHAWRGSDAGHNCADCPPSSIWRCDRPAHAPAIPGPTLDEQAEAIAEALPMPAEPQTEAEAIPVLLAPASEELMAYFHTTGYRKVPDDIERRLERIEAEARQPALDALREKDIVLAEARADVTALRDPAPKEWWKQGRTSTCNCGHVYTSHRPDPADPYIEQRCKTCGCAGYEDRMEARMQNRDEYDPEP